ncbi:MAG: type IV secretion system protein [Pseudomonadota bacterium]
MTAFYEGIFKAVDGATTTYITDKASAIITAISGTTTLMFVIYVALFVIAMALGKIKEPITDFAFRITKVALILGIGLNMGLYMKFIGNFLSQAPDQMAAVLSPTMNAGSAGAALDGVVDACYDRFLAAWHKAGILEGDFGMYLIAIGYAFVMIVGTLYTAFLIVLSKIALTVLVATGPLFVVLLMFNSTQRYFESWFGQAVNYGLVLVFTIAGLTLLITILSAAIDSSPSGASVGLWDAVRLIVVAGIGMLVMTQVPSMASAIGGGLAISTLGFAERVSSGAFRSTFGKNPYNVYGRDGAGKRVVVGTTYQRPLIHRTGQVLSGTGRAAKYLYRKASRADSNAVSK